MIPKVIHYCWFGNAELDVKALHCIESWKKFFPDYEIIQWNEQNFDISQVRFMQEAYDCQQYAFVSDVVRLLVVYQYGGIYFDTDVEVIKSFDDILGAQSYGFLGFEQSGHINTGLGFGFEKENHLLRSLIGLYENLDFNQYKDGLPAIACPILTTEFFKQLGLYKHNITQKFEGIDFYSSDFFSPINYETGKLNIKPNTHSIHWYSASWQNESIKTNHKKQVAPCNLLFTSKGRNYDCLYTLYLGFQRNHFG